MIQLAESKYPMAASKLMEVGINHLFAKSVLERRVVGLVHVDCANSPGIFHVKHPYGMSLVFGSPNALRNWAAFWSYLKQYRLVQTSDEWIQCWPEELAAVMNERIGIDSHICEAHVRLNFKFNPWEFARQRRLSPASTESVNRTGPAEYDQLQGAVVPGYFWRDRKAFLEGGIGFSLTIEGKAVSTAFSAFIHDQLLELGIETDSCHQGKGYAYAVCAQLIDYCLENNYEPVWSCRQNNVGSVKLAEKLGFEVTRQNPYYRLMGSIG